MLGDLVQDRLRRDTGELRKGIDRGRSKSTS